MIPALTNGGHSFKGAAAYYLQDKRLPGTVKTDTADRVAWTEVLNLPTADPERAWKMMVHTFKAQSALKEAAGVKATGRKLAKPVFAFSLAWHPTEKPTKEEMLEAAHESLQALGLTDHQAIIAAHTDEPHPHLHIIVNRVDPNTGVAARLSNSMLKLSAWAQAYEERRGRIFCAERVENNARRAGTRPGLASENRKRRLTRPEFEAGNAHLPEAVELRRDLAERFTVQAATEIRAARERDEDLRRLFTERQETANAARDRHRAANDSAASPGHATVAAELADRLLSDNPALSLAALTAKQSTFTRAQLMRLIGRHTPDDATFRAVRDRLLAAPDLVRLGRDTAGRERFTTRDIQDVERRMEHHARVLHARRFAAVQPRQAGLVLSADQAAALNHVLDPPALAAVSGFAGTGKSTLLNAARASWQAAGHRVIGAALSGIAVDGLQAGAGIDSRTIHARLYQWQQGQNMLRAGDVLVIDEAGMIGSRQMERLLAFASRAGAKVVLVGEAEQLQAIDAGAAFRAITDRIGAARLKTVRRQKTAWQRDATQELATAHTRSALSRYERAGMVHAHATEAAAMDSLIAAWDAHRQRLPDSSQIILAYTRDDVRTLNARARAAMRAAQALGQDHSITTASGPRLFAAGDRLYFLKNDTQLGVRNGSLAKIERIQGSTITVRLDGGRRVTVDTRSYTHIDHGYAATIHKSQGVTVDRAHLFASRNLDRHATYVAMTRHRERLDLHWSADRFTGREDLARILSRRAVKDTSLDYGAAEDIDARRQAAQDTHDRMERRATAFKAREATPAGRMANARSLSGSAASIRDTARLAANGRARALAFQRQQAELARRARRTDPATAVPPAPAARTQAVGADLHATLLAQARQTVQAVAAAQQRHRLADAAQRETRRRLSAYAAYRWFTVTGSALTRTAALAFNRATTSAPRTATPTTPPSPPQFEPGM